MTVLEVIQRSTEFLAQKNVESPRLQIELILSHVLKMPRLKLYLNFQRELSDVELATCREFVKRRSAREPLQYILGTWQFCGLEIKCSPAALIPRPETELLAERAAQFLSTLNAQPSTFLDIGTGTGCIAIALANKVESTRGVAVDVSNEALALAKENAARHNVSERIEFRQCAPGIFPGLGFGETSTPHAPHSSTRQDAEGTLFDLIVSNPPYIPSLEIADLQPEVREHEPRLALDGGADGLDVFRTIARDAKALLKPHGKFMGEFSDGQAPALKSLFESEKWIVDEIIDDYSARPRILIARPQ
ncbi:MAG TPA: peptide chain release factor N(5)-glutamine methyltransferase [Candidatus Acidoferrum sp.]|nr:peptide chain release factor N(5)-glutamine methyltransferase [Candidatus Acidoferrum sp.]